MNPSEHEPPVFGGEFLGSVHGRTIELDEQPPLSEGQRVVVRLASMPVGHVPGDGIRASAGSWAGAGPDCDEWLAEVYAARNSWRVFDHE